MFKILQEGNLLKRDRISKCIRDLTRKPLLIITAPIGYGKTTAVRHYLEYVNAKNYVWVSMLERNEKLIWNKFCCELEKINKELYKQIKKIGFPENYEDIQKLKDAIRLNLKDDILIIIDDYSSNGFPRLDSLMRSIIFDDIDNISIIVLERDRIDMNYIEMLGESNVSIIDAKTLKFDNCEIRDYLSINNIYFNDEKVKYIYQMTNGWIMLLQMVLDEYKLSNDFTSFPQTGSFFKSLTFDRKRKSDKDIILSLLPVEKFTKELALYILKDKAYINNISEILEDNSMFFLDENSNYCMYPILRDSIVDEFILNNKDKNTVLNSCADWYMQKNDYINSLNYYVKARNFENISNVLDRLKICTPSDKNLNILKNLFDLIPENIKYKKYELYISFLFSYLIGIDFNEGKKLYLKAKGYYLSNFEIKDRSKIIRELLIIDCILQFDNIQKMNLTIEKINTYLKNEDSSIQKLSKKECLIGFPSPLFVLLSCKDKIDSISSFIDDKENILNKVFDDYTFGLSLLIKSEKSLLQGNYENAEMLANKTMYKADLKDVIWIKVCAYFILLRIAMTNGESDRCENIISQMLVYKQESSTVSVIIDIALGYFYGCMGERNKIPTWIKMGDMNRYGVLPNFKNLIYIPMAFYLILKEKYEELEVLSDFIIEECSEYILAIIYSNLFKSIAYFNNNKLKDATKAIKAAIKVSKNEKIVQPFIELSRFILPLLEAVCEGDSYIINIINNCKSVVNEDRENNNTYINEKCILTDREMQVMNLVTEGYKQSEIAKVLYVSVPTVKKHMQKVYRKFNVNTKAEAIKFMKTHLNISKIIPEG